MQIYTGALLQAPFLHQRPKGYTVKNIVYTYSTYIYCVFVHNVPPLLFTIDIRVLYCFAFEQPFKKKKLLHYLIVHEFLILG